MAREDEVKALIDAALSAFGRLDCLFNNAGFGGISGEIETLTFDERYRRTVDAMLTGPLMGVRHAAPHLKAGGGGSILTTASVAGLRGGYGPHVYSAIKAGVIGMTRSLARELGPAAIRVNAICPGGIATPSLRAALPRKAAVTLITQASCALCSPGISPSAAPEKAAISPTPRPSLPATKPASSQAKP